MNNFSNDQNSISKHNKLSNKILAKLILIALLPGIIISGILLVPGPATSYDMIDTIIKFLMIAALPLILTISLLSQNKNNCISKHPFLFIFVITGISAMLNYILLNSWYVKQRGYNDQDIYLFDFIYGMIAAFGNMIIIAIVNNKIKRYLLK